MDYLLLALNLLVLYCIVISFLLFYVIESNKKERNFLMRVIVARSPQDIPPEPPSLVDSFLKKLDKDEKEIVPSGYESLSELSDEDFDKHIQKVNDAKT